MSNKKNNEMKKHGNKMKDDAAYETARKNASCCSSGHKFHELDPFRI
jgi:hypothetical protein